MTLLASVRAWLDDECAAARTEADPAQADFCRGACDAVADVLTEDRVRPDARCPHARRGTVGFGSYCEGREEAKQRLTTTAAAVRMAHGGHAR